MELKVRKYQDSDYWIVNKIIQDNFNVTKSLESSENSEEFVGIKDDEVVGYFILTKMRDIIKNNNWIYVEYVCVDLKYQNMGIGTMMMEFAINYSRDNNYSYIELTSNYKRKAAHQMYKKLGFSVRESNIFRRML